MCVLVQLFRRVQYLRNAVVLDSAHALREYRHVLDDSVRYNVYSVYVWS